MSHDTVTTPLASDDGMPYLQTPVMFMLCSLFVLIMFYYVTIMQHLL